LVELNSAVHPRNLSSFRRGIVVASLAIATVIVATAYFVSIKLREQTVENTQRELTTVSRITAERTEQTFSAADLLARSIQSLVANFPGDPAIPLRERLGTPQFHDALVKQRSLLPQVNLAVVADANGTVVAHSEFFPTKPIDTSSAEVFQVLRAEPDRGLMIGEPVRSTTTNEWMIFLCRALTDATGKFAGLVYVGLPIDYFEKYFSTADVGATGAIVLGDRNVRMLARWPHKEEWIGIKLAGPVTDLPNAAGESWLRYTGPNADALRMMATTRFEVQGIPLFLSVSQDASALLQPWVNALVWIVVFAVASLIGLAALAGFIVRAVRDEERWSGTLLERETRLSNQAAELLVARDEAERANRVRGEFLANMSHELRTPLNAISGFSDLLANELFGPLGDPRYREFVLDIQTSGKHLLEVIGNILDLTKVDAGKLSLDEQEVDLGELMALTGRLVSEQAQASGVRLDIKLPVDPVTLLADPTRLKQILLNLLSNAIKFTPNGGEVVLFHEVIDDSVFLRVADTGIGMTPEEVIQVMERFRQVDNSFSRRHEGTGLGLPLTKSLTELHGGSLEIQSMPGKGTTASVRLPGSRLLNGML
jgi:signal transduction histidine kinase